MSKKSRKSLFFKASLPIIILIVAGFFAFGWSHHTFQLRAEGGKLKPGSYPNLSTQQKSEAGGIIKPKENKGFLSFLMSSFGAENSKKDQTEKLKENKNTNSSLLNFDALVNSLTGGQENPSNDSSNQQSPPNQTNTTNSIPPFGEPKDEPAQSLYRYFVASSAIGFDQENIDSAVQRAASGNLESLKTVIAGYEGKLDAFRQLTPPSLAIAVHEQSAALIENYILFLKKMAASNGAGAKQLWLSQERKDINTEANKIIGEIQALEREYNFSLPSDVLPTN